MKTISRYIMTLALLITAATGAWADADRFSTEAYTADATLWEVSVTGNTTLTINEGVTVTVNNGLTISSGATLTVTGGGSLVVNGRTGANGSDGYSYTYQDAPWDPPVDIYVQPTAGGNGGAAITINSGGQLALSNATVIAIGGQGGQGGMGMNGPDMFWAASGANGNGFASFPTIDGAVMSYSTNGKDYTEYESGNTTLYRYMKVEPSADPSAIEVTTNAASAQDLFTEASFTMPAFDATADYELVRDMSIQMTATMGDGTNGVRYRVKKAQQGEGYEPADLSMTQVLALVAVNDGIEQKALTLDQDYTVLIYPVDENGQILSGAEDGIPFENFTYAPGLYALKAFAQDDSDYAGETPLSNTFKLFQGYEVEVAAKEFITYYKDEALYVEDEAAELYTIQSVNGDQAVLSDKSDAMPSNTPMLVYNKSNETKVILLIPCAEPDMALTVAPEFQGTLTGTTIAASTDAQTNYAFNGKQFVFVKNAIEVGPNKAWLSINTGVPSARITLVFDEATGVNEVIGVNGVNDGSWYDLNGRKLDKMPTKKGIYIMNGRKVVVR